MNKIKVRFMIIVCEFIKDWYFSNYSVNKESISKLIDDLNTELERE